MEPIIEVKNLTVGYRQNDAIDNISVSVDAGDFVSLAGPNGAGKTTFIKALLGLIPKQSGEIFLFKTKQNDFCDWQKIGYLPQKFSNLNQLFPASVEDVVFLGFLSGKKIPKIINKKDKEKVEKLLNDLDIAGLKNKMFFELSGGQQQRVLLARSLVSEPELLIFDEPSTALDPVSRESFFELIQKLNKEKGITIILISHDTVHSVKYANKLMYLDKKLIYFGSFSDFCASEKMGEYFGKHGQHMLCQQHNENEHVHKHN